MKSSTYYFQIKANISGQIFCISVPLINLFLKTIPANIVFQNVSKDVVKNNFYLSRRPQDVFAKRIQDVFAIHL